MDRNRVLAHQTVLVRADTISEVGPVGDVAIPRGVRRVAGEGRYLMPGLTDAHVHIRDESELLSYLRYGITTVVHLSGPVGNIEDMLRLRDRVCSGEIPGPTIFTSGPILDGDPPIFAGASIPVHSPEEARDIVNRQLESGFDFIKVYNNLPDDALRAGVDEAHRRGAAVFGHIPRKIGRDRALQAALGAGLDVVAHGEEYFFT
jgi:hypothetical protein